MAMQEQIVDADPRWIEAACALAPAIEAAADEIERERRLPVGLLDQMTGAGLFRMLVPSSLGGPECNLLTFSEVIEQIAKVDGSTAWCLGQGGGSAMVAGSMDRGAAETIFGDPRAIIAWGPGSSTATIEDGGYRLSGRWQFASGGHHATWMGGTARIVNKDGSPHRDANGAPEVRRLMFPASEASFTDVWHVSGLRGTGSDTYSVTDLFVSEAFAMPALASGIPLQDLRCEPGPLYAFPLVLVYGIGFASVALGIARGALDAFVDLAQTKTARGTDSVLREDGVIQHQVARAEADCLAARALLHAAIHDAWMVAPTDAPIPLEHRARLRLAATHAIHAAAQSVDTVYHAAGATAIFEDNRFERRFRDIHAVTQQGQGNQAHFKTVGQYLLGLELEPNVL
jgi:alkylation response protein AidB-like acyl-CoA dehydrogenase